MFHRTLIINNVEYKIAVNIKGVGAPTSSTEGAVGMLYMDESTGELYKCIATNTWTKVLSTELDGIASEINALSGRIDGVVEDTEALEARVGKVEEKIKTLEGLLEYEEVKSVAYEATVPEGAISPATLDCIEGKTYRSNNLMKVSGCDFYNAESGKFEFTPGMIFQQVIIGGFSRGCSVRIKMTIDDGSGSVTLCSNDDGSDIAFLSSTGEIKETPDCDSIYIQFSSETHDLSATVEVMVSRFDIPYEKPVSYPSPTHTRTTAVSTYKADGELIASYPIEGYALDPKSVDEYADKLLFEEGKVYRDENVGEFAIFEDDVSLAVDYSSVYGIVYYQVPKPNTAIHYERTDLTTGFACPHFYTKKWADGDSLINSANVGRMLANNLNYYWFGFPAGTTLEEAKGVLSGLRFAYALKETNRVDVTSYFEGYEDYMYIDVEGNGKVRFENEYELPVPSTITYLKRGGV